MVTGMFALSSIVLCFYQASKREWGGGVITPTVPSGIQACNIKNLIPKNLLNIFRLGEKFSQTEISKIRM